MNVRHQIGVMIGQFDRQAGQPRRLETTVVGRKHAKGIVKRLRPGISMLAECLIEAALFKIWRHSQQIAKLAPAPTPPGDKQLLNIIEVKDIPDTGSTEEFH